MRLAVLALAVALGIAGSARADYFDGLRYWDNGQFAKAVEEWRSAAVDGDRQAMLRLGKVYAAGKGVAQDYVEAHRWFSRAHESDHPDAAAELRALEAQMTRQELSEARSRTAGRRLATTIGRSGRLDPPPERIQEAQRLLAGLGLRPGPADGRWTETTRRAYQDFLIKEGLTPTGVLTVDGLRRLRAAAPRGPPGPRPRNTCTRRRSGATSTDCSGFSRPEST